MVGGLAAAIHMIDWTALSDAVNEGGSGLGARIEATNPGYPSAIIFVIGAATWAVVAAAVLYPAFQAMVLRWWVGGLRFGDVEVTSRLRTGQVYRAYFRFLLYGLLFGDRFLCYWRRRRSAVVELLKAHVRTAEAEELITAATVVVGYMILALGYSTIYQATVKLALWRIGMELAEISGVAALDRVKASGRPASPVGEGLADALHVGGI